MHRTLAALMALLLSVAVAPAAQATDDVSGDRAGVTRNGQHHAEALGHAIDRAVHLGGATLVAGGGAAAVGPRSSHPGELLRAARTGRPGSRTADRVLALAARQAGVSGVHLTATAEAGRAPQGDGTDAAFAQTLVAIGVDPFLGTVGSPLLVGDLDGDGGDDLVTLSYSGSGLTLSALRGVDGRELWVAPQSDDIAAAFLQAVGDVDGDGRRDLLATGVEHGDFSGSGMCDEDSCVDEYTESVTWAVTMLSGATGTRLWGDRIDGYAHQRYSYDFNTGEESTRVEVSNMPVLFHPSGDLDGDGGLDLISPRVSFTEEYQREVTGIPPGPSTSTESSSFTGDSTLLLLDGADGTVIDSIVEEDRDSVLTAVPVPDIDGDALTDLLATRFYGADGTRTCTQLLIQLQCEETRTLPSMDVSLLDGDGLGAIWTHEVPSGSAIPQAPADLTGDHAVDVVIVAHAAEEGGGDQPVVQVLDGTDGQELWRQEGSSPSGPEDGFASSFEITWLVGATPLDDVEGEDLIIHRTSYQYDPATGEEDVRTTLTRYNGATGEELLVTERSQGTSGGGFFFGMPPQLTDADGDGAEDILLTTYGYDPEAGTEHQQIEVESGRTGELLLTLETSGFGFLTVLGDVDGDGGSEAVMTDLTALVHGSHSSSGGSGSAPAAEPTQGAPDEAAAEEAPAEEAPAEEAPAEEAPAEEDAPPLPTLEVIRLDGGEVVWAAPVPPGGLTFPRPAGDLDRQGDGVDVVVETIAVFGDDVLWQTAARAGADGRLLWSNPPPLPVTRVGGETRTATAAALSAATHDTADTVVIARADAWPDAVAGGPLAALLGAPVLLSPASGLSADTAAEIARLGAERAILLGGEAALSAQVAEDLRAAGLRVERVAGPDRFTTAARIATRIRDEGGDTSRVAVVRGVHPDPEQGWSDAVVAAARGAAVNSPILLTAPGSVPNQTLQVIADLGATDALVLGGPGAVSVHAEQQVRELGLHTLRVAGFDRYSTARATADMAVEDDDIAPTTVWVATGRRFPDALAASAAAGTGGVLLLADGGPGDRASEVLGFIGSHRDDIEEVVLIGGPGAISPELESHLRALLSG